jgi:uncharacterized membrane protein YhaH (DUF805 family)
MYLLKLCFSFSGRINRAKYWLVLAIAFWFGLLAATLIRRLVPTEIPELIFDAISVLVFYVAALPAAAKRLHDLDFSGWWAIGVLSAFYLTSYLINFIFGFTQGLEYSQAMAFLFFAFVIWLGSANANRQRQI